MIEARELTKRYGDKTVVDHLSFTVKPGEVTGFLGPNGAGKSTTMRMVIGLDSPTEGSVTVNGRSYARHAAPLQEVGTLLEAKSVHPGRTAVNHLMALAHTHGIARRRVAEVIELAGLTSVAGKRVGAFSLGMGQRLGIAAALLGDPAIVMLDEPVNGLDPEGVLWVRNLLSGLAEEGRAVMLSSHLMGETALIADHLVIIGRGRLLADTTVDDFGPARRRGWGEGRHRRDQEAARAAGRPGRHDQLLLRRGTAGLRTRRPGDRGDRRPARGAVVRTHPAGRLPGGGLHGTHQRCRRVPQRAGHHRTKGRLMTTTALRRAPRTAHKVTGLRVLRSEWAKFWSLRSSWITLGVALFLLVLFGAIACYTYSPDAVAAGPPPPGGSDEPSNAVSLVLTGSTFASLAVGVLGVLLSAGEYTTGMIRSTLAAVPRRLPVLWSKSAVIGPPVLVLTTIGALVAFQLGAPGLDGEEIALSLGDDSVLRSLAGAGVYLGLVAVFGVALGMLIRSSAGAIAALVGALLILPGLASLLPDSWYDTITPYFPSNAGAAVYALHESSDSLAPGAGLAVFAGWVALALAGAAYRLVRSDA